MSHNVYFKYSLGQRVTTFDNKEGVIITQMLDKGGVCYQVSSLTPSGISSCRILDEDKLTLAEGATK